MRNAAAPGSRVGQRAERDETAVADATDLDEHLARRRALEHRAPHRADHRALLGQRGRDRSLVRGAGPLRRRRRRVGGQAVAERRGPEMTQRERERVGRVGRSGHFLQPQRHA